MSIETVADAIGAAKILYQGRDVHLPVKLDWWCQQLGPTRSFASITADDIDEGLRVLMETPKTHYRVDAGRQPGKKLRAPGTINKYLAALGTLYKLLKLHRRLPRSFTSPIVKGLMLPLPQGKTLQVSIEDVMRLIDAARLSNNKKLPALVAVACTTGLRRGSIQSITWGQIDLKARTIDVAVTKNGTPTRSILPTWASAELARIRPDNPEKHWEVFGSKDFKRAFATALERTGLPEDWTFHSCRHIAASILAQSGASLPVVMQALNHKTPGMALRYSHVNTAALEKAVSSAWG